MTALRSSPCATTAPACRSRSKPTCSSATSAAAAPPVWAASGSASTSSARSWNRTAAPSVSMPGQEKAPPSRSRCRSVRLPSVDDDADVGQAEVDRVLHAGGGGDLQAHVQQSVAYVGGAGALRAVPALHEHLREEH